MGASIEVRKGVRIVKKTFLQQWGKKKQARKKKSRRGRHFTPFGKGKGTINGEGVAVLGNRETSYPRKVC